MPKIKKWKQEAKLKARSLAEASFRYNIAKERAIGVHPSHLNRRSINLTLGACTDWLKRFNSYDKQHKEAV